MRRAICSSVMRMRSTSLRQRVGTVFLSFALMNQKLFLQKRVKIIDTKLRPSFHLFAFCLERLNGNKLDLCDNLLVFLHSFRLAKQYMHNAKVNSTDFGGIIVDQPDGSRVKVSFNRKFLVDFSFNSVLKRLQTDAESKKRIILVINAVSYTHLRAHETGRNLVCRLLL